MKVPAIVPSAQVVLAAAVLILAVALAIVLVRWGTGATLDEIAAALRGFLPWE